MSNWSTALLATSQVVFACVQLWWLKPSSENKIFAHGLRQTIKVSGSVDNWYYN